MSDGCVPQNASLNECIDAVRRGALECGPESCGPVNAVTRMMCGSHRSCRNPSSKQALKVVRRCVHSTAVRPAPSRLARLSVRHVFMVPSYVMCAVSCVISPGARQLAVQGARSRVDGVSFYNACHAGAPVSCDF